MPADPVRDRISLLIKARKREKGVGVREAARESGVSAATISRLERGVSPQLPDLGTIKKLAAWLDISVDELVKAKPPARRSKLPNASTPDMVEIHLRADKNLRPETARALSNMFKALYDQAVGNPTK